MLYEQIRHANTIRGIYKMRHLLAQKKPPDMGTRLGYPKYSKQFYRIKSEIRKEGIIGSRGTFVENPPNLHVAAMALRVDAAQISALGYKVPYVLFLALATGPPRNVSYLATGCRFSRKAVYDALRMMERAGLVRKDGSVTAAKDSPARTWLAEYLEAVRVWIDASEDTFVLFNAIPSNMGGPHVRRLSHYESGAPMGPAEMHIFTCEPLLDLMETMVKKSRYFRNHPKRVSVRSDGGGQMQKANDTYGNEAQWIGS